MKPFLLISTAALAFAASRTPGSFSLSPLSYKANYENILGTSMEIRIAADSDASAKRAETAALAEISRLEKILSGYNSGSEFRRWTATQGTAVHVSPELMEVLALWDQWRARTSGALNPAAEAIGRVWRAAETSGRLPTSAELSAGVASARASQWRLDVDAGTATHVGNAPLMLNSFTKSYVVEQATAAAMKASGVECVSLNVGGDLVLRGNCKDTVQVADPFSNAENSAPLAVLEVMDRAVATSGNYRRGYEIGGKHYSHIVDPRTGKTAEDTVSATVVAPRGVDAGALATTFSVVPYREAQLLAAAMPGTEFLLVRGNGTQLSSAGWNGLLARRAPRLPIAPQAASAAPGQWNTDFELTLTVELPRNGGRRPFLAVWVEDKDRFPVRTVALWFDKQRWLNELRAWYRADRLRSLSEGTSILSSVTSATRSPGKYTFKWDGKDNAGKLVKAGKYTVFVEAAREHGGYTLLRQQVDFNGTPSQAQLPADAEAGPVSFDYHKVH
jgi:thiamine biosynthesis lipoprotein ApbE